MPRARLRSPESSRSNDDLNDQKTAPILGPFWYYKEQIMKRSSLEWNDLDIDQKTIYFGMLSNGTDNATATFCGW